jgi:hypothetical protein
VDDQTKCDDIPKESERTKSNLDPDPGLRGKVEKEGPEVESVD